MAEFQDFLLVVTLGIAGSLLLIPFETEAAVAELGKVKCIVFVNFTEQFDHAHHECHKKMHEEMKDKGKDKEKEKKEHIPFPFDSTIEDFEWDDHCRQQCIYKTAGILSDDGTLPKKADTTTVFGKGKVSDDRYKVVTSAWDDCLAISEEIGKKKGWDICKIVTHHEFCFMRKLEEAMTKLEVDC